MAPAAQRHAAAPRQKATEGLGMTLDAFKTNGSGPPETIAGYRIHPAANLFPLMTEPELQALADDIKKHEQQEPILVYEDPDDGHRPCILDGRNRALACERLGIDLQNNFAQVRR